MIHQVQVNNENGSLIYTPSVTVRYRLRLTMYSWLTHRCAVRQSGRNRTVYFLPEEPYHDPMFVR
jgi:hypothetical protein